MLPLNNDIIPINSVLIIGNEHIMYICNESCCIPYNKGYCWCNQEFESVKHYFLNCVLYDNIRNTLFANIAHIYNQYNIPINIKNLLFPLNNIINRHRKHILQSLFNFVIQSKRFNYY